MNKWYFTFGIRHLQAGYCQPIIAIDEHAARNKMFELHGRSWAFQYSSEEWERHRSDPTRGWALEIELPTIEAL